MPSGRLVCRCHDVFLWRYVGFVLPRFRLYAFVEAAALRSIVLRYAGAPIAARVYFYIFGDVAFPSIFCTISAFSLYGEYVVRSFLPNGVFLPCHHGWIFDIILLCENSINSINHHYHPARGHWRSSYLSLVHALRFFIAMQVQQSYNSSTNGYIGHHYINTKPQS